VVLLVLIVQMSADAAAAIKENIKKIKHLDVLTVAARITTFQP
jgi:hypothetical protein